MRITPKQLADAIPGGWSETERAVTEEWPNGAKVTPAVCRRAAELKVDFSRVARLLLSPPVKATFDAAMISAHITFDTAIAPARAVLKAETASARGPFDAAIASAHAAFDPARPFASIVRDTAIAHAKAIFDSAWMSAQEAFDMATAPAEIAYRTAKAEAFATAVAAHERSIGSSGCQPQD